MAQFSITKLTSEYDVSKKFIKEADEKGSHKRNAVPFSRGKAETVAFKDMLEFKRFMQKLGTKELIMMGIGEDPVSYVAPKNQLDQYPGTIQRSKENFPFVDDTGLLFIDYDPADGEVSLSKDYLLAQLIKRFFALVKIEAQITLVPWEWMPRHMIYPNTREGYSWEDEDWWLEIHATPGAYPEVMGGHLEWTFHSEAAWQHLPKWLMLPLDKMYKEVQITRNREKRFQIYKEANEYIADQAFWLFTVAPMSLYGANEEFNFVPQPSQYLYLDYSSVSDNHWSLRGK